MRRLTARAANLSVEQLQAVEQLTRSLVNKLQHAPIQAIKRAAREGDRETMAVIQNVFDLEAHPSLRKADVSPEAKSGLAPEDVEDLG